MSLQVLTTLVLTAVVYNACEIGETISTNSMYCGSLPYKEDRKIQTLSGDRRGFCATNQEFARPAQNAVGCCGGMVADIHMHACAMTKC